MTASPGNWESLQLSRIPMAMAFQTPPSLREVLIHWSQIRMATDSTIPSMTIRSIHRGTHILSAVHQIPLPHRSILLSRLGQFHFSKIMKIGVHVFALGMGSWGSQ